MDESWRISRDVAIRQRDEAQAELQAAQEREKALREAAGLALAHAREVRMDSAEDEATRKRLVETIEAALDLATQRTEEPNA